MKDLLLEPVVAAYFSSSNARDPLAFASCFAPDAVVVDEGTEIRGLDAVLWWRERTTREYDFFTEPKEVSGTEGRQIVKAFVTGDFPGSPIDLHYVFDLREGRIERLETMDDPSDVNGVEPFVDGGSSAV